MSWAVIMLNVVISSIIYQVLLVLIIIGLFKKLGVLN